MRMTIAILEDNDDRIAAMRTCLADKFPFYGIQFFRTAEEAIRWLRAHMSEVICVSLDHDLDPPPDSLDSDPGTGRLVADFLAASPASFPVIVHSSNAAAAIGMEMALTDAGWNVSRVLPFSDLEWIVSAWLPLVRRTILDTAQRDSTRSAAASLGVAAMLSAAYVRTHQSR